MERNTENINKILEESEGVDIINDFDFEKFVEILRGSILFMILIIGLSLGGSYLFLRYTKALFQSSSDLRLSIRDEAQAGGVPLLTTPVNNNAHLLGEIEFIKSELLHDEVIKKMNLELTIYAQGNILDNELYGNVPFEVKWWATPNNPWFDKRFDVQVVDSQHFYLSFEQGRTILKQKYRFRDTVRLSGMTLVVVPKPNINISKNYYFTINSRYALLSYLQSKLKVDIINHNAGIIRISFKDHNAEKVRDIVNVVDTVYLEKTLAAKSQATLQQTNYLNEQLEKVDEELTKYESLLEGSLIENKTTDLLGKFSSSVKESENFGEKKADINNLLNLLDQLEAQAQNDSIITALMPDVNLPGIDFNALILRINALFSEIASLSYYKTDNNATLKIKRTQLIKYQKELRAQINEAQRMLNKEIGALQSKFSRAQGEFLKIPSKETELKRIKRLHTIYEAFYSQMLNKKAEIGITRSAIVPEFVILAPANPPTKPIYPVPTNIYTLGLAVGVILSFFMVAIRYLLNNTVANQKELEKIIIAPVLGVVPFHTKQKGSKYSKMVILDNPKSTINEALRSIRTNLDFVLNKSGGLNDTSTSKVISITSTISGEGKTFVAANLAGIIAMLNLKVLIIDFDMRRPKVHIAFDKEEEDNLKGTSTILIGRHTPQECIQHTLIENLDFIPSGPIPPNPSELILRPVCDELIKELTLDYDVIILDTPPIGLVTDGVLLMQKAEVPIYIFKANYSKKVFSKNINKLILKNNFTNLSVILNAVNKRFSYGYGYGYGYGSYYGKRSVAYYNDSESNYKPIRWINRIYKRALSSKK